MRILIGLLIVMVIGVFLQAVGCSSPDRYQSNPSAPVEPTAVPTRSVIIDGHITIGTGAEVKP